MKLPSLRFPARVGWRDHVVGAALGSTYLVWLLSTARSLGFPRDEGVYFRAGSDYWRWWRMVFERGRAAFQQGAIDSAFGTNHEHPVLMKTLFGASEWRFHEAWHVFSDASTAYRFPTMVMAAMALWVIYLFGARVFSRRAGVVAAVLFALMPRVFFNAHLACFDLPIAAVWILFIYVYYRATETRGLGWIVATGVVFGLALETKHNAWSLPFVVLPHAFFVQRHAFWRSLRVGRVSLPGTLVSMAVVGPIVFFSLWPYLWNDTLARLQWWVEFHLHHDYYNIEFLGKNYFGPPSPKSYLPVMVAATVPTVTLLLSSVGVFSRLRVAATRVRGFLRKDRPGGANDSPADRSEVDLLLALSFVGAVWPFFVSTFPIFGGTKHWLPAYPVLVLFAGRGFDVVLGAMRRALPELGEPGAVRKRIAAEVALFACVVAAPLATTAHSHPFGLSAYVPLVGGTAGGADLGLNRQFWGFTTESAAAEYLNPAAPRGATVFILDTTWEAWARMQEEGRVRSDLRVVGAPHEASLALVQHELHMSEVDYDIWVADGTDAPTYIVEHDGVPIVSIYRHR